MKSAIVQKTAKYSSWILKSVEYPLICHYSKKKRENFSVFIIGAPRSGSTIFYQLITNFFKVAYPDNLINYYRRNALIGFALSKLIYNEQPHNCYKSDFGNTDKCGLHAPNEFGQFWYRWLPKDRHYITSESIPAQEVEDLKNNLKAIENYCGMPLVYKNLNMGQRIRLLAKILPNAKFIWIKREPFFTVQSIYLAKRKLKLATEEWWSVMPENVEALKKLEQYEQIVKQVFYIERQIFLDKKLFPNNQILEIDYELLDKDFENVVERSRVFINPELSYKENYKKIDFRFSNTVKVSNSERKKLQYWINKLDWQNYEI